MAKPRPFAPAAHRASTSRAQILTLQFAPEHPPKSTKPTKRGYTAAVTSHKGVIGIGVPKHLCDASRRYLRRDSAALLFAPPVFGGSDGEPQGSPVLARGARYANPSELPPPIGVEGGGFCKSHLLEAIHG